MTKEWERISTTRIIYILEETGFSKLYTFDYDRDYTLFSGRKIDPKMDWMDFCRLHRVEARKRDYLDAIYYWAMKNTPKPVDAEQDALYEVIEQYLENKEETSIPEILKDCLRMSLTDRYRKTWENKVARILKALNWTKRSNGKRRYWIREAPKLPEVLD